MRFKKILSLILTATVLLSLTVFPVSADDDTITSFEELRAACQENSGGTYYLGSDIVVTAPIQVTLGMFSTLNIFGNGHTVSVGFDGSVFDFTHSKNCYPSFVNVKFDGANRPSCVVYTSEAGPTGSIPSEFLFENCTFSGFADSSYEGAVILKRSVRANFIDSQLNASVYAGDSAQLNVNRSSINSMVLAQSSTLTAAAAEIDSLRILSKKLSALTVSDDNFIIKRNDMGYDDQYKISAQRTYTNTVEDQNDFELNLNSYKIIQLLGVQLKERIPDSVGSSAQETGRDMRFVAVINEGLAKGNNIEDYGFVVGKASVSSDAVYASSKLDSVLKYQVNRKTTISCKGTYNNLCGDYGNVDESTPYKYFTMSVNGIDDNSTVMARFYVKTKSGKIYYSDYDKTTVSPVITYPLCAANYSEITGEYV